ncbi:hypothetical protein C8F01DRAFT_1363418 [Mycena amicta]|nr:hypothetical protein C8F01DRAFT_1363418 [Mycena amicta]
MHDVPSLLPWSPNARTLQSKMKLQRQRRRAVDERETIRVSPLPPFNPRRKQDNRAEAYGIEQSSTLLPGISAVFVLPLSILDSRKGYLEGHTGNPNVAWLPRVLQSKMKLQRQVVEDDWPCLASLPRGKPDKRAEAYGVEESSSASPFRCLSPCPYHYIFLHLLQRLLPGIISAVFVLPLSTIPAFSTRHGSGISKAIRASLTSVRLL